jgi:hypothetical protein
LIAAQRELGLAIEKVVVLTAPKVKKKNYFSASKKNFRKKK